MQCCFASRQGVVCAHDGMSSQHEDVLIVHSCRNMVFSEALMHLLDGFCLQPMCHSHDAEACRGASRCRQSSLPQVHVATLILVETLLGQVPQHVFANCLVNEVHWCTAADAYRSQP